MHSTQMKRIRNFYHNNRLSFVFVLFMSATSRQLHVFGIWYLVKLLAYINHLGILTVSPEI